MKSLLLIFALSATALVSTAEAPQHIDRGLNMQLDTDLIFQKMVRIYDYNGSLVREFPVAAVANNEISVVDNMILDESDFAFDYFGDYYYFGDSEYIQAIVN